MSLAIEIVVLVAGLLAVAARLRSVPAAPDRRRRRRPGTAPRRFADLERVEQATALAETSASDVHRYLRPLLREIAAGRLVRHGIVLDRNRDRAAARAALGEELWTLVAPDAAAPEDPRGPGLPAGELAALTTRLERL